jgi:glycerol-3-phosphate dehydrogenase
MRRNPTRLAQEEYDVVVVGGGIYGACAAWEAAVSGLRVALIDAGDFGHATSSNSLRTLHGGLRHLQRLDFVRMRESIRARREWLQLAPHLARPMRFALPTSGHGLRGPQVMRMALRVNDLISFDRNRDLPASRCLPSGTVWSEKIARAVFMGTEIPGCNGAAVWYDAVCSNTERLLIAVVAAAVRSGTNAANYMRATELVVRKDAVCGVRVRDELTQQEFLIRTRAVINATGPWTGDWIEGAGGTFRPSRAFNLLTRQLPFEEGIGLPVPVRRRAVPGSGGAGESLQTCFVMPWNGRTLIGTRHLPCAPASLSAEVTQDEVRDFMQDLNGVLGRFRLSGADVLGVFSGLLPESATHTAGEVELQRSPEVRDHASGGMQGLFSVVGVKWTTSRQVAQRVVRQVGRYLARPLQFAEDSSRHLFARATASTAVAQASAASQAAAVSRRLWRPDADVCAHLEEMYGPFYPAILNLVSEDSALADPVVPDLPVIQGQVAMAVRQEMAVQLADVVMRRTPLYLSDALDGSALAACAAIAARELRWTRRETAIQIEQTVDGLRRFRHPVSSTGDEINHARATSNARLTASAAAGP